jgi:hypothetical protein
MSVPPSRQYRRLSRLDGDERAFVALMWAFCSVSRLCGPGGVSCGDVQPFLRAPVVGFLRAMDSRGAVYMGRADSPGER